MEFRQLEYFIRSVELGSYSAAAKELFVSQPAITKAIRNLEDELHVQLVEFIGKSLKLTDAGQILFNQAAHIENELNQTISMLDDLRKVKVGKIRLATCYSGEHHVWLCNQLSEYLFKYPNVQYESIHMGNNDVIKAVANGDADIGFCVADLDSYNMDLLVVHILNQARYAIVVNPDHPLAKKRGIEYADLNGETVVFLAHQTVLQATLEANCQSAGATVRTITVTDARFQMNLVGRNGLAAICSMDIENSSGSSTMPASEHPPANYAIIPFNDPRFELSLVMIHRKEFMTPALSALITIIEKA